jgi:murein DD-endopeptidase MepM/ murein hydrolase activator NlpD
LTLPLRLQYQAQPNGGGIFVGIVSDPFNFPAFTNTTPDGVVVHFVAGTYRVLVDLLHCESISVKEGETVVAGQQVAIGDNTGFSTGPH